jgi:hypothetical protein
VRTTPFHARSRRILGSLAIIGTAFAVVGTAAPASAIPSTPAPFTYCPVDYVSPEGNPLNTCLAAVGTGGTFKLGSTVVTLTPGTTLQGGLGSINGALGLVPAVDGMTLAGPAQSVPGGLLGVAHLEGLLPGVTDIKAQVELVGTPNFVLAQDIQITLPVVVRLQNALLGPNCMIGSAAHPIDLHLTTGMTSPPAGVEPISGAPGMIVQPPLGAPVLEFKGQTVVDNTFAVPGATGCGALGLLNSVVNAKSKLPSPAGTNVASLVSNSFLVAASQVDEVSGYVPGM